MKAITLKTVVLSVASLIAFSGVVWGASNRAPGDEPFPLVRFVLHAIANEMALTDSQIAEGKEIARRHQPAIAPLVDRLAVERKVLRELLLATPINEGAIRAQTAKMQAVQTELILESARVRADLRKLLTPAQTAKASAIRERLEAKVQKGKDTFREWLAVE